MITKKHYNEMAKIIREASWLIDKGSHTAKEVGIDYYDLVNDLGLYFEKMRCEFISHKFNL